jgi:preprotein translocase subunit SecF
MTLLEIILTVVVVVLVFKVMGLNYRVGRIHKYLLHVRDCKNEKFMKQIEKEIGELLLNQINIERKEDDKTIKKENTSRQNGENKHQTKKGPKKVRKSTSEKRA